MSKTPRRRRHQPIYIDRCLGKSLPEHLIAAGYDIVPHHYRFKKNCIDADWLEECGEKRWTVLTKDKSINRNEMEKEALLHSMVKAFVISAGDMNLEYLLRIIGGRIEQIIDIAETNEAPFICRVTKTEMILQMPGKNDQYIPAREERLSTRRSAGL